MKYHFKAVAMLFAVSIFKKIYLNFEKNMQVPILAVASLPRAKNAKNNIY